MRKQRRRSEADQRLCFRYTDSTISLLLKYQISSFLPASVTVQSDFVGPGRKPRRLVFSRRGSNDIKSTTFSGSKRHVCKSVNSCSAGIAKLHIKLHNNVLQHPDLKCIDVCSHPPLICVIRNVRNWGHMIISCSVQLICLLYMYIIVGKTSQTQLVILYAKFNFG